MEKHTHDSDGSHSENERGARTGAFTIVATRSPVQMSRKKDASFCDVEDALRAVPSVLELEAADSLPPPLPDIQIQTFFPPPVNTSL